MKNITRIIKFDIYFLFPNPIYQLIGIDQKKLLTLAW